MKCLLMILIIFLNSNIFSCELIKASGLESKFDVCYFPINQSYLSKECQSVKDCFPLDHKIKEIYPNQSPGFTQCYAIQGEPFFAEVSNDKSKIPFCKRGKYFIDIESLMIAYKKAMVIE